MIETISYNLSSYCSNDDVQVGCTGRAGDMGYSVIFVGRSNQKDQSINPADFFGSWKTYHDLSWFINVYHDFSIVFLTRMVL